MWSLVPRPVRRYRREHPYSHPLLFLFVDMADSSLKFLITCGVIYGAYFAVSNSEPETNTLLANNSVTVETPVAETIQKSDTYELTTIVSASSSEQSAVETHHQYNDSKTLLDNEVGIRWIEGLPESHYVIQFATSVNKTELIEFATNHLKKGAVIYPFKLTSDQNAMYGLASGLYDSMQTALQAIDKMPEPVTQHRPWVRPVTTLKRAVRETAQLTNSGAKYSG